VRFQEVFMLADITLIPGKCKKCGKQGYVLENNLLCIKCAGKLIIKRLKSNKRIEPTAKAAAHPSR